MFNWLKKLLEMKAPSCPVCARVGAVPDCPVCGGAGVPRQDEPKPEESEER